MSTFMKYVDGLISKYGNETAWKLFMLRSMILTYRTVEDMGIRFRLPVALIVDSARASQKLRYVIKGFAPAAYASTDISDMALEKVIMGYDSEMLLMQYSESKHAEACLHRLAGICESGVIGGEAFHDPVMVVFIDEVPPGIGENFIGKIILDMGMFSTANEDALLPDEEFARLIIDRTRKNWLLIECKIRELTRDEGFRNVSEEFPGAEVFLAVMCYLEIFVEQETVLPDNKNRFLAAARRAVDQIKEEWNVDGTSGEWGELFRKVLFKSAEKIPGILDMEAIGEEDARNIGEWPLYDDRFYYIPEKLFGQICASLNGFIGIRELKQELAGQGFIKTEGRKRRYYTMHVPLMTKEGKVYKVRAVCLYRDKVDVLTQLPWKNVIKMKGGEKDHDNGSAR